jgi:hypothetical protein
MNIDPRDPNSDWRLHAVLIGFGALVVWKGGVFGLIAVPAFAWVASRWIVLLVGWIKSRAERDATNEWHGRYFAHDGIQMRVYWDEQRLWIVADDVFLQLGIGADAVERGKIAIHSGGGLAQIPGCGHDGFSETGVLHFLGKRREPTAHKLKLWIERSLIPNIGDCRARGELHMPGGGGRP